MTRSDRETRLMALTGFGWVGLGWAGLGWVREWRRRRVLGVTVGCKGKRGGVLFEFNNFFLAKTSVCLSVSAIRGLVACQLRGKTPALVLEMAGRLDC